MPYIQLQLGVDTFLAMFREGLDGQMVSPIDEERIENVATLFVARVEGLLPVAPEMAVASRENLLHSLHPFTDVTAARWAVARIVRPPGGRTARAPSSRTSAQDVGNLVAEGTTGLPDDSEVVDGVGDPGRARTFNPEIKSLLLYH